MYLIKRRKKNSFADPGCLSWIPYPNFSIADPGSGFFSYPGSASNNLSILTKKIGF
jgi:hypothetical protein